MTNRETIIKKMKMTNAGEGQGREPIYTVGGNVN
jgi:hypothetical protein